MDAVTVDGLHAGHAGVGMVSEFLAVVDIGKMDFHRGQRHGLERVEDRDGGMGVSSASLSF